MLVTHQPRRNRDEAETGRLFCRLLQKGIIDFSLRVSDISSSVKFYIHPALGSGDTMYNENNEIPLQNLIDYCDEHGIDYSRVTLTGNEHAGVGVWLDWEDE